MDQITRGQLALILASTLGLAGCASLYGPTQPEGASGTMAAASDVVCTRDVASGTRFLRTTCMSKVDYAARTEASQRAADSMRTPPPEIKN